MTERKYIILSANTYDLLRSCAESMGDFTPEGKQNPDGTYTVPFQDSTLEELEHRRFPGESIDHAIYRIVSVYKRGMN